MYASLRLTTFIELINFISHKKLFTNDDGELDDRSKEQTGSEFLPIKDSYQNPKREMSTSSMVQQKKETAKSPKFMQPIRTDMNYKEKVRPQKMILARKKVIRTFYGCETELQAFEEDLLRR